MTATLRIAGLSKTYPNGVRALDGVTLAIPPGMYGLLGPNGAGKSTLMRTLATLQDADAGSATLGELDVLRDKDAVRRILGYLPQDFGVYPKVSALDMLDHLARLKGIDDRGVRRDTVEARIGATYGIAGALTILFLAADPLGEAQPPGAPASFRLRRPTWFLISVPPSSAQ